MKEKINRRDALKLGLLGAGALAGRNVIKALGTKEEREVKGGCTNTVYEAPGVEHAGALGITVPKGKDGDSVSIVRDKEEGWVMEHELTHAEQVCRDKDKFWNRYWNNKDEYEREARIRGAKSILEDQ